MSEARTHRFEIDIDEIERQLRRSIEEQPAAKPDPLAELARIVGQNDPFRGILAKDGAQAPPSAAPQIQLPAPIQPSLYPQGELPPNVHVLQRPAPVEPAYEQHPASASLDDVVPSQAYAADPYRTEDQHPAQQEDLFDPVADTYGSQDAALAEDDFQPLRPRRSRGRLAVVMAGLLVTVGAVAGGLYMKGSGGLMSSGPKLITADTTPLKVAPENPGGIDVPNQNRQIYEQGSQDGQSRVVDGREQPIDVRAAARTMPTPTPAAPQPGTVSARAPVSSEPSQTAPENGQGSSAVANALGDPRRVRTVAVNPDGSHYGATTPVATAPSKALVPGGDLPPPVSVTTVPVPARTASAAPAPVRPTAAAPAEAAPAATAPAAPPPAASAPAAPPVVASAGEPPVLAPVMDILPPKRPRLDAKTTTEAPTRTASLPAAEAAPKAAAKPKPAAEKPAPAAAEKPATDSAANRATYTVQIAVRPSEDEARTAWSEAQDKFGSSLENKPARLTTAKVGGKTVHRVRLGPMTKQEADAMCGRLKSKGGACFVATN